MGMGLVRQVEGRTDEAVSAFRKSVELSDEQLPVRLGLLGAALARNGDIAEARSLLERAESTAAASYFPAFSIAMIHLGLGDIDAMFSWMERAVDESDPNVVAIHTHPGLAPLRAHPRFGALLRRMNLAP